MNKCSGRGSSFLFFVGIILPLTLFALTLAADFSGIMLQSREAQTVADAAARAAGTTVDGETGKFIMNDSVNVNCRSRCSALDRATQMYDVSVNGGIVAKPECAQQVTVTSAATSEGNEQLTVTIPYSIKNLSFLKAFFPTDNPFGCMTARAQTSICAATDTDCIYDVRGP